MANHVAAGPNVAGFLDFVGFDAEDRPEKSSLGRNYANL
jgi:hypothetical protein